MIGNNTVEDRFGMRPVLLTFDALRREGKYGSGLEYKLLWRTLTGYNNTHKAREKVALTVILISQESSFYTSIVWLKRA